MLNSSAFSFYLFLAVLGLCCYPQAFHQLWRSGVTLSSGAWGFSLKWLLLLQSTSFRHKGFSSCSMWAQQLWHKSLVTWRHLGSSLNRDRTGVPCSGRQTAPNHRAAREAPQVPFQNEKPRYHLAVLSCLFPGRYNLSSSGSTLKFLPFLKCRL